MRKFLTSDHLYMISVEGLPMKANIGIYIKMRKAERKQIAQTHCLVGAWWVTMKNK